MPGNHLWPGHLSITNKLLILVAMVSLSFAAIIAWALLSLNQVKNQSTSMMDTQISALISNSITTRDVSQLFNQIHLFSFQLHDRNPDIDNIEKKLLDTIESIKIAADSPSFKTSILELRTAVVYAVDIYRLIDYQMSSNRFLEQDLMSTIDQFDVDAGEWEFQLLASGQSTVAAQQLQLLLDSYRKSLERIVITNASQRTFAVINENQDMQTTAMPLIEALRIQLKQLPVYFPTAKFYKDALEYKLEELLLENKWFYQQLGLFSEAMISLSYREGQLLKAINQSSEKTNVQSQALMENFNSTISSSSWMILFLSIGVMLTMTFAVLIMVRKSIHKPIAEIVEGVEKFSQGHLLNRIQLDTNDELSTIGHALNDMAIELHESYTELKDSEDKFYQVFENEINALLIFDQDTGRCLDANRVALDLYNVGLDEIKQLHLHELEQPQGIDLNINVMSSATDSWVQTFHKKQDGTSFPVEVHTGVFIRQGHRFLVKSVRDMTEQLRLQSQQQHTTALLEATVESTNEAIVAVTNSGDITNYNRKFANIFNLELSALAVGNIGHLLPNIMEQLKDKNDFLNMIHSASVRPDEVISSDVLEFNDGRMFECQSHIQMLNGSAVGRVWNFRDVSEYFAIMKELREKESRLAHIAHHDSLTGLPNRLLFLDRLDHAIQLARRSDEQIAVFFIDLDRFKSINDTLGHQAGDVLLKSFSKRLKSVVRQNDTIARLGGDEFTVILEAIDGPGDAAKVADKVLETLREPFESDEYQFYVTSSIGISLFPEDGENAEKLLKNADVAMYKSKDEGRNTYHFYAEEMTEKAIERVVIEASLREALEEGQFVVYYQPQIDLKTSKFLGAEALVRWQHPIRGVLSPSDFLLTAEETGLIDEIDQWVFQHVCEQISQWEKDGVDLEGMRFAINLSGRQLRHQNLPEIYKEIMDKVGCDARYLELEISEGFVMHQPEESMKVMNRLQALGFELSIDDFGTGYSSLSYLKRLPLTKLKIDRSFVEDIVNDPNDAAISKSVIALGHSMNLLIVAEGVETQEQRDFLRKEGCDTGQGYFFSRPTTGEELLKQMDSYGVEMRRAI